MSDKERKEPAKDKAKLPDYMTPIEPQVGKFIEHKLVEHDDKITDKKPDLPSKDEILQRIMPDMLALMSERVMPMYIEQIENYKKEMKEKLQTDPKAKEELEKQRAVAIHDSKESIAHYEKLEKEAIERNDQTMASVWHNWLELSKKLLAIQESEIEDK